MLGWRSRAVARKESSSLTPAWAVVTMAGGSSALRLSPAKDSNVGAAMPMATRAAARRQERGKPIMGRYLKGWLKLGLTVWRGGKFLPGGGASRPYPFHRPHHRRTGRFE